MGFAEVVVVQEEMKNESKEPTTYDCTSAQTRLVYRRSEATDAWVAEESLASGISAYLHLESTSTYLVSNLP